MTDQYDNMWVMGALLVIAWVLFAAWLLCVGNTPLDKDD